MLEADTVAFSSGRELTAVPGTLTRASEHPQVGTYRYFSGRGPTVPNGELA